RLSLRSPAPGLASRWVLRCDGDLYPAHVPPNKIGLDCGRTGRPSTGRGLPVSVVPRGLMSDVDLPFGDQGLNQAWVKRAACAGHPEWDWFSRGERMKRACRAVCAECVVQSECLAVAIASDEIGIWAGLEQRERRLLSCGTA